MISQVQSNNEDKDNDKDKESKIKIFRIIGLNLTALTCKSNLLAEKKIVPGLFLLFSLVYWTFGLLCYYDFTTHFTGEV